MTWTGIEPAWRELYHYTTEAVRSNEAHVTGTLSNTCTFGRWIDWWYKFVQCLIFSNCIWNGRIILYLNIGFTGSWNNHIKSYILQFHNPSNYPGSCYYGNELKDILNIVQPVFKDHPWEKRTIWSLFTGSFVQKMIKWGIKRVVAINMELL